MGKPKLDTLGLTIDMLDVDRLRQWADNLLVYGADVSQWGDRVFVAGRMQQIATGVEKAIKDIGVLRGLAQSWPIEYAALEAKLHDRETLIAQLRARMREADQAAKLERQRAIRAEAGR